MTRRIPASGINLFQLIYILIREYSEKTGLPPLNLSLGNPDGVPPESIRRFKAFYAENPGYDYHTYAEDKNLHAFAEGMVELHGKIRAGDFPHLRVVPIAGIKTASAIIPLACGQHLRRGRDLVVACNVPAYDIVGTWSNYLGCRKVAWPLASADNMRLKLERLEEALKKEGRERADLVFVIRPGNPAAVGASQEEWRLLAQHCVKQGTRLVNDAAYSGLAGGRHVSLASVAKDYPGLEWIELYSVSKSFNDPGARLGAMVGSKDFIEDYIMIKGNTDSGPVPSVMAAYGEFFKDRRAALSALEGLRLLYERRLSYLIPCFKKAGLRPACDTEAGFFTLWKVPRRILGMDLAGDPRVRGFPPQEAFNRLVASETGIVGVHFEGACADGQAESLIRYAVCADVLDSQFQSRFESQLSRFKPEY